MTGLWSRILDVIQGGGACALVSVVAVEGSAPREAGARLLLRADGFHGTIGGGALEWEAVGDAGALLARGRGPAQFRRRPLGPALGQCCGGQVVLLTETFGSEDREMVVALVRAEGAGPFETIGTIGADGRIARALLPDPPGPECRAGARLAGSRLAERFGDDLATLLLFGAGHVGRALVLALAPLPIRVRWIDSRAEAFPARAAGDVAMVHADAPAAEVDAAPPGALVLVMTHSHPLDLRIVARALARPDLPHVGLIGSATKRARFVRMLRESGLGDDTLARLVCPIGVPGIAGKEPAIIAAGVAAQLLQWRQLSQRREPALSERMPAPESKTEAAA